VRGRRYVYARYFQQEPPYEYLHDLRKDPDQLQNLVDDSAHAKILKRLRKRCDTLRDEYGGEYDPSLVANYKKEQNRKRAEAQARRKAAQLKKQQKQIQ